MVHATKMIKMDFYWKVDTEDAETRKFLLENEDEIAEGLNAAFICICNGINDLQRLNKTIRKID
jgi:hypothetical protein